jgi:hypothetical protein
MSWTKHASWPHRGKPATNPPFPRKATSGLARRAVGFEATIAAAASFTADGTTYEFQHWSDGGAAQHTITVPASSSVLTATYAPTTAPPLVTVLADADARVAEALPDANYARGALRADGGKDPDVETYLRFTVPAGSSSVQSARLRVYATTGTQDGPAVFTAGSAWSEASITWNARPARSMTGVGDKGAIPAGAWVEYDVTALVTGPGTYTLALATTSSDGIDFTAREGASNRPELVITT